MNQTITLTLVKPLIIESVKNDTFRKGQFDKAVDQKAATAAYQEQAGDDSYHERTIERALYTSIEELKTHLSDYICTSGLSAADNSISSDDSGNNILITLVVGGRFNKGYTQSLARLAAKYVEDSILFLWWSPINEKQATFYAQLVERDLAAIKRCFNKTAPTAPTVPYTSKLEVTGSAIELEVGEEHTVTYTLSDNAVDDIEAKLEDNVIAEIGRSEHGFTIHAKQRGHTYATLYSRHNDSLTRTIHIYITDHT